MGTRVTEMKERTMEGKERVAANIHGNLPTPKQGSEQRGTKGEGRIGGWRDGERGRVDAAMPGYSVLE